jgi:cytosine deaminase
MMDLTIHHALHDKSLELVNVGIKDGRIVTVTGDEMTPGTQSIDACGAMLSPALIEPHFHIENALLWETDILNRSGTLHEAIDIYARAKVSLDTENILGRASRVIRDALANGTLWMRNHVDIDQYAKLSLLKSVVAVREKYKHVFDLQIVAFPQHGMARNPETVDLMWQAMESGAQVVGGIPHHEKTMDDAARQIEIAFEIAKARGVNIDMHVDETDDPYWKTLELLAEKTIEENYQGRVTAGHCTSMAAWDKKTLARVIAKVKQAGLTIVANVPVNLILQGHGDETPVRRGIARLAELLEAGVNVCCGQDDLLNMFYPFGQMDPLEVANITCHAGHLTSPDQIKAAFDMPRYNAARNIGLQNYGVHEGAEANLILLKANSAVDALRRQPERIVVIRHGEILVHNQMNTDYSPQIPS